MTEVEFYRKLYNVSAREFSWNDHAGKTVMDIGCGKYKDSADTFLKMYPNIRNFIAIDSYESMLIQARQACDHPKVEHHVADILDWSTLLRWEGQIHVIVSFFCFNCFNDKRTALENVHKLLAPGGTATIVFFLKADHYYLDEKLGPKYREHMKNLYLEAPESHKNDLGASYYREDIEQIGFDIRRCDDFDHVRDFETDEECKDLIFGMSVMSPYIPDEVKPAFQEDLFTELLKYRSRNEKGYRYIKIRIGNFLIQKRG